MTADEGTTAVQDAPEATEQPQDTGDWENSDGKGGKKAVLAELATARRKAAAVQRELDQLKQASMTEQEKLVAEAKAAGQTEAARATAPRLVRAELRAAAAEAGLAKDALDGFLEYADLARFVGDDGEPDAKAIAAAVKRLGGNQATDFDGGARTPAGKPADMNSLIRRQAGMG